MALKHAALALAVASGCTDDVVIIAPVIETAINADADAFSGLDRIEITIAHAGDEVNLASRTFERGDALEIRGAPFGDDLVIHLRGFAGERQVAYGRTCAFKVGADTTELAPRVFFSRTQKFADTNLVPASRDGGGAVSILGSGVFLGGGYGGTPTTEVERFDPSTGELEVVATIIARTDGVSALIGTSPRLVAMIGGQVEGAGATFFELIDLSRPEQPVENHPNENLGRTGVTVTSLTDGRVVAVGGKASAGLAVGTITEIALIGTSPRVRNLRAVLAYPRVGHTATRLGDDVGAPVLIVGGTDGTGTPIAIAELFKPLSEELANPATFAPAMVEPRSRHQAALMPDGSVLVIGGVNALGAPVRALEKYTVDAGFVAVGELPISAGIVDATVTELPDGRILIAGGRTSVGGSETDTAFVARLDLFDGSVDVVATDRLGVTRAGHQAASLCDGTVLLFGGGGDSAIAERYNPPESARR